MGSNTKALHKLYSKAIVTFNCKLQIEFMNVLDLKF